MSQDKEGKKDRPKPEVPAQPPVPSRPKPLEGDESSTPPDPPPPGVPVGPGKTG